MKKSTKTDKPEAGPTAPAPQTKRYDDEFKRQAVENWIKTGKPGTQIATELGVSYPSLKEWKRRYYGDATPKRDDLAAENRALKAELARVREQRDILKKRWASSPNHPRALPSHRTHEGRAHPGPALRRLRGEAFGLPCLDQSRRQPTRAHRCAVAAEDPRRASATPGPLRSAPHSGGTGRTGPAARRQTHRPPDEGRRAARPGLPALRAPHHPQRPRPAHRAEPAGRAARAHRAQPNLGHGPDLRADGRRLALRGGGPGLVEPVRGGLGHHTPAARIAPCWRTCGWRRA